jgi:hypothetical protein
MEWVRLLAHSTTAAAVQYKRRACRVLSTTPNPLATTGQQQAHVPGLALQQQPREECQRKSVINFYRLARLHIHTRDLSLVVWKP